MPTVVSPTVVALARSWSAAARISAGPAVESSIRTTTRPFQAGSPAASSGLPATLRDTTVAIGPLPRKSEATGAASAGSPPIDPRRSRMTVSIERRAASSSSFFTAAAVAGVNAGILTIATSRSQVVEATGRIEARRGSPGC